MSEKIQTVDPNFSRRDFLQKARSASVLAAASKLWAQKVTYQPLDTGKKLRIGVVGGGFGAHFPWHRDPNCVVTGISELREDRRKILMNTLLQVFADITPR